MPTVAKAKREMRTEAQIRARLKELTDTLRTMEVDHHDESRRLWMEDVKDAAAAGLLPVTNGEVYVTPGWHGPKEKAYEKAWWDRQRKLKPQIAALKWVLGGEPE